MMFAIFLESGHLGSLLGGVEIHTQSLGSVCVGGCHFPYSH